MQKNRVAIVGGGRVGMSAAYAMLLRNTTRELVLFDRDVERMKGEQLEFEHSLAFLGTTDIIAAESPEDLKNSDVVIYTTGVAQEPGQSRLDLVKKNSEILASVLPQIAQNAPNAVYLVVTNPVDILTLKASRLLKLPKGRVLGTGTSLDSARFRFHLSQLLGINPKNIHAYVLGEHGDSSFAAVSNADVGGQRLMTMPGVTKKAVEECYKKVKDAASTIIAAKGATYYAIGVVINQLVDAILRDTKRVYPVSTPLDGQYGYSDVSISLPCVLGKNGVEKILEVPLSEEEKKLLANSISILKS